MNMPSVITDNITELLIKIIEFTQMRQKILTHNINNVHFPGFVPKDFEVDDFSDLLNDAVDEHIRNGRLILRDTKNIKFGTFGRFEVRPVADEYAKELLEKNPDEYLELQANKFLENSINHKVAAELLKQKQGIVSIFE